MTSPRRLPTDEELEARLRASWARAVGRAGNDLADGALAGEALARARRRSRARLAWAGTVAAAAVVVAGTVALAGGALRTDPPPSAAPGTPPASPVPGETTVPAADDGGFPILAPGITFPPEVDGRSVIPITADTVARITAAPDASPVLVSGWFLYRPDLRCTERPAVATPGPNGVMFGDCFGIPVSERVDGGAALLVHPQWASFRPTDRFTSLPATQAMRVLVEVHVHDPGCGAADCATEAVLDRVLQYGQPRYLPAVLAATMPPGGITMARAIDAALAYGPDTGFGEPLTVLSVEAGPYAILSRNAAPDELGWVWLVTFVSDDGHRTVEVPVGFTDGTVTGASSGDIDP